MLTHSLIQYLTLPATPPPPVALAAGVRFIHKARMTQRMVEIMHGGEEEEYA